MTQLDLMTQEHPFKDFPVEYIQNFLPPLQAAIAFEKSLGLEWTQNSMSMYGKRIAIPRLECIFGDREYNYTYSNSVVLKAKPWPDFLRKIKPLE